MRRLTLKIFFFQAEDGIRDYKVTGVQTCALPISRHRPLAARFVLPVTADAAVCALCEAAILRNPSNIPGGARFPCARIRGRRTTRNAVCNRTATCGSHASDLAAQSRLKSKCR